MLWLLYLGFHLRNWVGFSSGESTLRRRLASRREWLRDNREGKEICLKLKRGSFSSSFSVTWICCLMLLLGLFETDTFVWLRSLIWKINIIIICRFAKKIICQTQVKSVCSRGKPHPKHPPTGPQAPCNESLLSATQA
jgi:hypothetical protein